MKRIFALALVVALCLSLVACGGDATNSKTKNPLLLYYESSAVNTNVFINIDRLADILEIVELTTENWKEYIKVYSYSIEKVETNAFGEVTSSETNTYYQLGAGNERYHCFENVAIELKNKATGELTIYEFNYAGEDDIPEDFDLNNYECTRIQGKLVFADLPEESLYTVSWDNKKHFSLSTKSQVSYQLGLANGTNEIYAPITPYLD